MKNITYLALGLVLAAVAPSAASAADDLFLGTWRLNKTISTIGKDPGVKSKEFVFTPSADGVLISETLVLQSEPGKSLHSQIPYAYGKSTPQASPGLDTLFVVKGDSRTAYWTGLDKGKVVAQLQINLSDDGKRMTFRYLWSAADTTGKVVNDRYVYEKQ